MNTTYPTTTVEDTLTTSDMNEKLTMAKEAFVFRDQYIEHLISKDSTPDMLEYLTMFDASRELYERDIAGIKSKYKSL
jgi:hypothetical protein